MSSDMPVRMFITFGHHELILGFIAFVPSADLQSLGSAVGADESLDMNRLPVRVSSKTNAFAPSAKPKTTQGRAFASSLPRLSAGT